jgi:hypothetical protein
MSGILKKIAAFVAARKLFFSVMLAVAFVVFKTYYEAKTATQFFLKLSVFGAIGLSIFILMKWQLKTLKREIEKHRETAATIIFGKAVYGIIGFPYDYILYPLAILMYGIWYGGTLMAAGSGILCYAILKLYDKMKVDWLGIELIKNNFNEIPLYLRRFKADSFLGKLLWIPYLMWWRIKFWFLQKGGLVAFLYIATQYDPFYVVAYFRKKSFDGMTTRDRWIFAAGIVVSNGYWAVCNFLGILIADFISRKLIGFGFISFIHNLL